MNYLMEQKKPFEWVQIEWNQSINLELINKIANFAKDSSLLGIFNNNSQIKKVFNKVEIKSKSICYAFHSVFLLMDKKFTNKWRIHDG